MPKTTFLKVRLDADEMLQIEKQSRALNMPKSKFARLLLTGGGLQNPQPALPSQKNENDETRLAGIESRLQEIDESLHASAHAFDTLLQQLAEFLRIPSFREYRGRAAAEGVSKRENETEEDFLIRLANRYFLLYQAWPSTADSQKFGPVPSGVDLSKFPKSPPRV